MSFVGTLPHPKYCGNEDKLIKCVFMREFVQLYGGPTTSPADALFAPITVASQVKVWKRRTQE